jgi:DNA-binding NtrC family response regulator
MSQQSILVVDDEKNIRLTLTQTLKPLGYQVATAVNGEDALKKLEQQEFNLILLDLKMPGMTGIEVLRRVVGLRPDIRVIIISAHGTIESAVEAMKLGAVDFIQKPFTPAEIRDLVTQVLDREVLESTQTADYNTHVELAKHCASKRQLIAAMEHAKKAIALDPSRPQAFNLLGAIYEIQGERHEAMNNYRVALDLDPTYQPAWQNLGHNEDETINLG